MNYNEIKLSIYESFDNGEIDEMEKDILLERLEEKEIEDESITLEEAMDEISSYLSESTAQARKANETKKKIDTIYDEINKLKKLQQKYQDDKNFKMAKDALVKVKKLEKEKDTLINKLHRIDPDFKASDGLEDGRKAAFMKKKHGENKSYSAMRDFDEYRDSGQRAVNKNRWRGNSERKEEVKGRYKTTNGLKESVDNLKLQVYEACEYGNITEEEKNTFLEYLNLDNYECKEVM